MKTAIFKADWLTDEFFGELGYILVKHDLNEYNEIQCSTYHSTPKHIKHKITGHNQSCGHGQRVIQFNREYFVKENAIPHIYFGIRDDGNTRTIFDGVVTSKQDILDIIRLVD